MTGELLQENVGEIHDMILNLRPTPAVAAAPTALGSAAVCFCRCARSQGDVIWRQDVSLHCSACVPVSQTVYFLHGYLNGSTT